jgi:hypothetical protein
VPAFVGEVLDPTCSFQTGLQIIEYFIGHIDAKRFHRQFLSSFIKAPPPPMTPSAQFPASARPVSAGRAEPGLLD